jgi:hypothetical protein
MNHQGKQNEDHDDKEQEHSAEDQWQQMLPGLFEPTCGESEGRGNSNQHRHTDSHSQSKQELPNEIPQASSMSLGPVAPDFAALRDYAIEQDEAHNAAHIEEHYPQTHGQHDQQCDQRGVQQEIDVGKRKMLSASGTRRGSEAAAVAPSGTEFTGKKTHERKLHPFSPAKWVQELFLGVLEGGTNGIDRGNRQSKHLAEFAGTGSKVSLTGNRVN